jgi:drug/metabolite transporter (DMT)-like permease
MPSKPDVPSCCPLPANLNTQVKRTIMTALSVGLIIAVGSALCWAALDITRKFIGGKMSATGAVAGMMLLHIPLLAPVLFLGSLLEPGGDRGLIAQFLLAGFPSLSASYFAFASGSVLINLLANYLFLRAVQVSPLSLTTPYLAFTPVFTAFVALVTIGQVPTSWGWGGIAVVCVGAFAMNPGEAGQGPLAPLKALWTERGSLYMLIVALLWSITPVLDKQASDLTHPLWHTMFLAGMVGMLFLLARVATERGISSLWKEFKTTPKWLLAAAMFSVGAMTFQLASYAYIDVAYVETVKRALGVTSAIAAGYFLFGERDIARRLVGAVVMCVGVAMILLGG